MLLQKSLSKLKLGFLNGEQGYLTRHMMTPEDLKNITGKKNDSQLTEYLEELGSEIYKPGQVSFPMSDLFDCEKLLNGPKSYLISSMWLVTSHFLSIL